MRPVFFQGCLFAGRWMLGKVESTLRYADSPFGQGTFLRDGRNERRATVQWLQSAAFGAIVSMESREWA